MSFSWRFFTMRKRSVICILVAAKKDGTLFYLTEFHSRQELAIIKNQTQFLCPACNSSVILKIGKVKTPHFAHLSLSQCDTFSEPESPLHLQGKTLLYHFFSLNNFIVELEKYLPAIQQRADLLIDQKTAIEFQCSPVPAEQIVARSTGYLQIGITPIWIGGLGQAMLEGIQLIKLTSWKRKLVQESRNGPYLIYFAPDENSFYYFANLFYVGGNQWVGKVKSLAAANQRFPFGVPKPLNENEFETIHSIFSQARKKYIASQFYAKNRYQNPFWRLCYELQLDIAKVPEEIGIPLKHAEIIALHPVLWQLKAIAAANKSNSITALIHSGEIPLHDPKDTKKAEALIASYLAIYDRLKEQADGNAILMELLYHNYCKTV